MALQAGMGLSRIVFIIGAGYTGTILVRNNKLSEILGEIQNFVKGLESGDSANADADPIAAQVRWLAQEVRQLANTKQITVLNGSSSRTDLSSLILPAATLGALGYGYMWWNGLTISDLMYVTKGSMAAAVDSLKGSLQSVYTAVEKTKKHLVQRLQVVEEKIDEQRDVSNQILNEVNDLHGVLEEFKDKISYLAVTLGNLEDKFTEFDGKQDVTLMGLACLVQFIEGKSINAPTITEFAEEFRTAVNSRCRFTSSKIIGLQGLLSITSITEDELEDAHLPKNVLRCTSVKAAIV